MARYNRTRRYSRRTRRPRYGTKKRKMQRRNYGMRKKLSKLKRDGGVNKMRRVVTQDLTDIVCGYDVASNTWNTNTDNQMWHLYGVDPGLEPSFGWYGQMQIYPNIYGSWGNLAAVFKRYKTKFIKIQWIPRLTSGNYQTSTAQVNVNKFVPLEGDGVNNRMDTTSMDVPVIAYRFTTQGDSCFQNTGYTIRSPKDMENAFDAVVGCGDAKIRRLDRPFSIMMRKPKFRQGVSIQGHNNPVSETYRDISFANSKYLPTRVTANPTTNDFPGGTVAWGFVEYAIKNGPRYDINTADYYAGALGQYGQWIVTTGFSLIDPLQFSTGT